MGKVFKVHGIPFRFLVFQGEGAKLSIGDSRQRLYIPKKYFDSNGVIKEDVDLERDLDWWFNKPANQRKIEKFKAWSYTELENYEEER